MTSQTSPSLVANLSEQDGVLVVDKAIGPTSHDVVAVARGALRTREIGHTGTLDPMASGVLVLVVGQATKLVNSLTALQKRYEAIIKLGVSTSTLDAQGEVEAEAPVPALSVAQVEAAARGFLGERDQRAPIVSAIKREGTPLYKRARKGEQVEAPVRRVRLDEVEIQRVDATEIALSVRCGSGYYVRAFARDLAASLETLGHLTMLRRTHNGLFDLARAVTFAELLAGRTDESVRAGVLSRLIPLRDVCRALPHLVLDEEGTAHARQGRPIPHLHIRRGDSEPAPVPALTMAEAAGAEIAERPVPVMAEPSSGGTLVALDVAGEPVALVTSLSEHLRVVRGFRAR